MKWSIVISLLILSTFWSCSIYIPQPAPIPLLSHKNEIQAAASVSIIPALSASCAYSPLNHVGLQAYGLIAPDNISNYQASLGYYWKSKQAFNMELYGGFSKGQGMMTKNTDQSKLIGNYQIWFLQYNLGQSGFQGKNLDYGFGIKSGICNAHISDRGYYEKIGMDPIEYNNTYLQVEPSAFIRYGKKSVTWGLQVNGASFIKMHQNQKPMPSRPVTLGMSVNFKLPGK